MHLIYPISLAVVASSISILIWVWFWTRKQELNNKSAIFVFVGGAFVGGAVPLILALSFQKVLDILIQNTTIMIVFLLAIEEEILKLSVVLCAIKFFKIDKAKIVIYMIIAALGFAASENVLYAINFFHNFSMTNYGNAMLGILQRALMATILHFLASGILGIGLLKFMSIIDRKKKILMLIFSIIVASVIHAIFNLSVTRLSVDTWFPLVISMWVFVLIMIYIVFRKENRKTLWGKLGAYLLIMTLFLGYAVYIDKKVPKYTPEVLASWQAQLKGKDDVRASYFDTGPNFTESLKALDSIRSQLRQIVITMEENRSLSSEQLDFLSSYNAYVNQYICILRKQEIGVSIEGCVFSADR